MSKAHPFERTATLPVMLATATTYYPDLYESYYKIPVASGEFSTERKVVERGQGPLLKSFLQAPVRTSRDRSQPATHTLPDWMYRAVERYIVQHGHANWGYTFELVGIGEPWVGWVLQRLKSRTSMRFHHHGPFHGSLAELRERASEFQLAYWCHDIHFIMRMNAFGTKEMMDAWTRQHLPVDFRTPIDRQGAHLDQSNPSAADEGKPWFESMGSYRPQNAVNLDPDAAAFAFRELSNWQLFKAYFNRGPWNPVLNFFNAPLEAARLHWDHKSGILLAKFCCDLRLEIYT
jgi:hypothetical protein